jgi:hypothetical protein
MATPVWSDMAFARNDRLRGFEVAADPEDQELPRTAGRGAPQAMPLPGRAAGRV